MGYSLLEIIEIITKHIGDGEMQFLKEYEAEGFSARQMEYLDVIKRLGNPNLGEIARALKLSKPSVTAIVYKLAAKKYIRKFQSDEDRRSFHVHLSAKGEKLVRLHQEAHQKIAAYLTESLNENDVKKLVALLNKAVSGK